MELPWETCKQELVTPDLDAARSWYQRAAEAGHVNTMNCLGDLYARLTEPPDLPAARRWYERAARPGTGAH